MKYEYRPHTIYTITLFKFYFISLASQLWKLKPSQLDFAVHEMARAVSPSLHIPITFPPGKPMASTKEKRSPPCGCFGAAADSCWQLLAKATRLRKCEPRQVPWQRQCNPRRGKHPQSLRSAWSRPDSTTLRVTERDLEAQENGFLVLRKTAGVVISLCELGLPVKCLLLHLLESTSSRECKCCLALSITEVVCSEHYEKKRKTQCYVPTQRWQNAGGQRQNHDPKLQMGRPR